MGKLRASLFSFRARGRIGGHRGAPGAPLAPVGPMWHKDLLGLAADDHPQYPLLLGRAGGQTLIGGVASQEHLTLQSTAHAYRGYIRAQDDLQLLSNNLRGSDAVSRLALAPTSPNVALTGSTRLGDYAGIGVDPLSSIGLRVQPNLSGTGTKVVIESNPTVSITSGTGSVYGFKGQATVSVASGASVPIAAGLYFTAVSAGHGTITDLYAAWIRAGHMQYLGPAAKLTGLKVRSPFLVFSTYPTVAYGVDVDDQGVSTGATHIAIGLRIADQTKTTGTKYLIEAGPATPYLRLVGGAAPGAGLSNLWVNLAGVLKQVQEDAANSAGAGFRRLRVVN